MARMLVGACHAVRNLVEDAGDARLLERRTDPLEEVLERDLRGPRQHPASREPADRAIRRREASADREVRRGGGHRRNLEIGLERRKRSLAARRSQAERQQYLARDVHGNAELDLDRTDRHDSIPDRDIREEPVPHVRGLGRKAPEPVGRSMGDGALHQQGFDR